MRPSTSGAEQQRLPPLDCLLLTGFLGAGKTTLLRRLVHQAADCGGLGILVNEFADLPVDSQTLRLGGGESAGETIFPAPPGRGGGLASLEVVALTNGSIFCGCLKPDCIRALAALARREEPRPLETLIIEGSGLADPGGMRRIAAQAGQLAGRAIDYRGSICLVDATNFLELSEPLTALESQAAASSVILLNKIDLADAAQAARVEARLREFAPRAAILPTSYGQTDIPALLALLRDTGETRESADTPGSRLPSYTLESRQPVSLDEVQRVIQALSAHVLRVKGFLQGEGGGFWHVEYAAGRPEITPVPAWAMPDSGAARTGLAVIGRSGDDLRRVLRESWRAAVGRPMTLRWARLPLEGRFTPDAENTLPAFPGTCPGTCS